MRTRGRVEKKHGENTRKKRERKVGVRSRGKRKGGERGRREWREDKERTRHQTGGKGRRARG